MSALKKKALQEIQIILKKYNDESIYDVCYNSLREITPNYFDILVDKVRPALDTESKKVKQALEWIEVLLKEEENE